MSSAVNETLDLEPGDHVCALYWGVDERDEVMIPFLTAGLGAGDKCICVVHATSPDDVLQKLGDPGVVNRYVTSEQLDVRSSADTYLKGGRFSVREMLDFYEEFVRGATAEGGCARVAGEGAWALEGYPGVDQLIDYEAELNRMVSRHPQMILCLYDLELFGGGILIDLVKTHPRLLLRGMMFENPYYILPDEFLAGRRRDSSRS